MGQGPDNRACEDRTGGRGQSGLQDLREFRHGSHFPVKRLDLGPSGGTVDGHCPSAGGMQASPGADGSSVEQGGPGAGTHPGGEHRRIGQDHPGVGGVPAFFCRKHFCLYLVNWVGWGHRPSTDEETEARETRDLPDPWHLSALSLAPGPISSHTSLQATQIPRCVPVLTPQGSSSAKRDIIQARPPLSDSPHLPPPWSWKRHWEDTRGV